MSAVLDRAVLDRAAYERLRAELHPCPRALPTLLVLAADVLLAGVAAWLGCRQAIVTRCAASALLSLVLLHFYLIHHECAHQNVFARERHNLALGELLGVVLAYPFRARRRSHMLHHVWAGHLERDPANARARARLARLGPGRRHLLGFLWRTWFPFLALNDRIGLWHAALWPPSGQRHAMRERWSARGALALYALSLLACVCSVSVRALLTTHVSALFLLMIWEELINLPHHIEAPTSSRKLPTWEQGAVSHSCRPIPFWSRFVLLHFNLHTAHHVFPKLPWFRLPDAARALAAHGESGSGQHELAHSLRLRRARFSRVFAGYLR